MIQVDMVAAKRENFGKGEMRRLRGSGNTPAILYGNEKDPLSLQLETGPFLKTLFKINRKNAVVNLSIIDGETRHVMVKEIQTDPVTDSLVHADFHEVDLHKTSCFTVGIKFVGKAKGQDLGGDVVVHNTKIKLEGVPLEIPDVVTVDVTQLGVNQSIRFADIALPENIKMASNGSILCVEVISAAAAAAAAAAESAADDAADAALEADAAAAASPDAAPVDTSEDESASEGEEVES